MSQEVPRHETPNGDSVQKRLNAQHMALQIIHDRVGLYNKLNQTSKKYIETQEGKFNGKEIVPVNNEMIMKKAKQTKDSPTFLDVYKNKK